MGICISRNGSVSRATPSHRLETPITPNYSVAAERICGGEVAFELGADENWVCPSWKLAVRLPSDNSDELEIKMHDSGVEVRIRP
jgi:hypothetical protein